MAESYKPFGGKMEKPKSKKPRKKGFFERMGDRWGDAAADYLLEPETNPALGNKPNSKKKK